MYVIVANKIDNKLALDPVLRIKYTPNKTRSRDKALLLTLTAKEPFSSEAIGSKIKNNKQNKKKPKKFGLLRFALYNPE